MLIAWQNPLIISGFKLDIFKSNTSLIQWMHLASCQGMNHVNLLNFTLENS